MIKVTFVTTPDFNEMERPIYLFRIEMEREIRGPCFELNHEHLLVPWSHEAFLHFHRKRNRPLEDHLLNFGAHFARLFITMCDASDFYLSDILNNHVGSPSIYQF